MPPFEARHVVASSTQRRVLFGALERTVAVLDLTTKSWLAPIDTTFDFGGSRIALCDELDGVLAAAYHQNGLAFYDCMTGNERWRRRDLKRIQYVTLSRDARRAFCGREKAALVEIDLRTGATLRTLRDASTLVESPFEPQRFVDARVPYVLNEETGATFRIKRTSFGTLDAVFAPGQLILSEVGGPVRCLDTCQGIERWRFQPTRGHHIVTLGYCEATHYVLGIQWCYQTGGPKQLLRWSLQSSDAESPVTVGEPSECCFALNGSVLVTSDGKITSTSGKKRPTRRPARSAPPTVSPAAQRQAGGTNRPHPSP